jgi:hypothetical protein
VAFAKITGQGIQPLEASGDENQVGSAGRELAGELLAETGTCSCDEGGATAVIDGHVVSFHW